MHILKDSFFNRQIDKISNNISRIFEKSRLYRIYCMFLKKIKQSFIAEWFMKPEKEIDVFESSKIVKTGIEKGSSIIEKGEKYSRSSALNNILAGIKDEFLARPVFVISMIVLSATAANTILWLLLKDFTLLGIISRILLIIASLVCLNIKSDYESIAESSILVRRIKALYSPLKSS